MGSTLWGPHSSHTKLAIPSPRPLQRAESSVCMGLGPGCPLPALTLGTPGLPAPVSQIHQHQPHLTCPTSCASVLLSPPPSWVAGTTCVPCAMTVGLKPISGPAQHTTGTRQDTQSKQQGGRQAGMAEEQLLGVPVLCEHMEEVGVY